ncbi:MULTISPECIES: cupin domain-containing protein [Rufibacter]|uniref:Mannose-6-phosphate isomerase-like protein (Cupin superfamily) n=1 Tax=Rufibacter quisquiliarum TaxID=1549639 RepID=A0A839GTI3_9BACT|nr:MULTISPECIES: cupin domain-containing protein [Rufibacter]MBA9078765.1 mannose-6-phosphate isomerase-like protein (cupin superfamily) [Rufibacter quisquiliarum]
MNPLEEFLQSGIIELYVLGATSPQESLDVEQMAAAYPEVRQEIDQVSLALEAYASAHAVEPKHTIKPLVLATVDYMERMKQGEVPASPPELTPASTVADYEKWLQRPDMTLPDDAEDIFAKIIGYTPKATTAIVWVKDMTDFEVHHEEYERFLILEGTCDMVAGEDIHQLAAGDFFAVPLHTPHMIKVTSQVPCKAVLQRITV